MHHKIFSVEKVAQSIRSTTYCCCDANFDMLNISCKDLKKKLEENRDGLFEEKKTAVDEIINLILTNIVIRRRSYCIATWE